MRLVVAVLTYRRPAELARMLPTVLTQARAHEPPARIVVVDNDPDGSAGDVVPAGSDVRYVHEPTPGIAAARNRALDEAADADAVVFVDDDEVPADGWLTALAGTWRASGASAVTGPVEAVFATRPDAWIQASGRFERRRLLSGTVLPGAASNNLLLDLAIVRQHGLRFDDAFGLTGGEDTAFTRDLTRLGGRIVWCDDAVVVEHVPADRVSHRWVLRREFRSGASWSAMSLRGTRGGRRGVARLGLGARGSLRVVEALARWGVGVVTRDVGRRARGACLAAANLGLVAGAFGHRYREYGR